MPRKRKPRVPPQQPKPTTHEVASAELLVRWTGGDQAAAREIFERYVDRLTRLARARLSAKLAARLDPDDVVMSAYRSFFVGARDGRFTLKESGDLWRLLAEITMHKLYRAAAHHRARRRSVAKEAPQGTTADSRFNDLISRDPAPDQVAAVADELEATLAALPPLGRRVLELRLRGEGVEEIAREIRRSTKTVRRWLEKAKRSLLARQEGNVSLPARRRGRTVPIRLRNECILPKRPTRQRRLPRRLLRYDDYDLRRMIGAGATGKVYIATCRQTSTDVAVKFLAKSFLRQPSVVTRFVDEAVVLARLKHPGVIRLHGLGRTRHGGLFIVMDLMNGGDLAKRIANGPIAFADAARWTAEAADAIQHAHEQGVIHCDLKPSNLLLDADGHVVVTDFGLALDEFAKPTDMACIAGTPAFMAPEQVADSYGEIGPHTDLYGLGAVLYSLLTGRPPHTGVDAVNVLATIVSGKPVAPPDSVRRGIPPMLARICTACLAKHPNGRLAHAGALARALRDPMALRPNGP
jgi:RNA polymerase sigma factor (sigma-70 family)